MSWSHLIKTQDHQLDMSTAEYCYLNGNSVMIFGNKLATRTECRYFCGWKESPVIQLNGTR
eukprot:13116096-Heterocapsa_arctica.AAC.1